MLLTIITWLFSENMDSTTNAQLYFNAAPYYIGAGLILLAGFYYMVEGRKKIPYIKNHTVWKYVLDHMLSQVAIWAVSGIFIVVLKVYLYYTLFSWNLWLILWAGWFVGIIIYWVWHFTRKHGDFMTIYNRTLELHKFMPEANKKIR